MEGVPLRYVPYHRLGGRPNVVVDGAATEGTVLTLSHWPHTPCPAGLEADLSAEMAFSYLEEPLLHGAAEAVSNNHFDQDGLVSVFALTDPDGARNRRDILVDLAAAGDFGTYRDRRAARASMAIAAFADEVRTPLGALPDDHYERTALLYSEMAGRLPEILDHQERWRALWGEEDDHLSASESWLGSGKVTVEERIGLDLAVVRVPTAAPDGPGHRFADEGTGGLHPMAVHNATACHAVLTVRGRFCELEYRYEGWVQYRSRRLRPRVDLSGLAGELSGSEKEGHWEFDGVEALVPKLRLVGAGESSLPPDRIVELVCDALESGPPAWDPYARPGSSGGVRGAREE